MSDEKQVELEIKISHQEIAIEELQKVLWEQQRRLDGFEKTLRRLQERVNGGGEPEIGPANEKPPHY